MKITYKDYGAYRLHFHNTNKFKTTIFKIELKEPIKKENITKRNLLFDILFAGSEKYDTERKINIELEELYDASIYQYSIREGNYITTIITLEVLDDKYTEENNFEKSIEFISEILLKPLVNNNSFDNKKVELYKNKYKEALQTIKENPNFYASIRSNEEHSKNSVTSIRTIGYIEDIDQIDEYNLYDYYLKVLKDNLIDFFVVGNKDYKEINEYIKKYFKDINIVKRLTSNYIITDNKKITKKNYIESVPNEQSILVMTYSYNKLNYIERYYTGVLLSLILGGSPSSKLFQEVREKEALCYFITSQYRILDGTIKIYSGIDKNNYKKTKNLIIKIINQLKKKSITEEDINNAKTIIFNDYETIDETPNSICNYMNKVNIIGSKEKEESIEIIKNIKRKDILKLIKSIKLDSTYLLAGDKND